MYSLSCVSSLCFVNISLPNQLMTGLSFHLTLWAENEEMGTSSWTKSTTNRRFPHLYSFPYHIFPIPKLVTYGSVGSRERQPIPSCSAIFSACWVNPFLETIILRFAFRVS